MTNANKPVISKEDQEKVKAALNSVDKIELAKHWASLGSPNIIDHENPKYELIIESKKQISEVLSYAWTHLNGMNPLIDVFQIRALRDFGDVKAGEIGGWVTTATKLSHDGNCWVSGNSVICENANVNDDAIVKGSNLICGSSDIHDNAVVSGRCVISGRSTIENNAKVMGKCNILTDVEVSSNAVIKGNVTINGDIQVTDTASIRGNIEIKGHDIFIDGNADIFIDSIFKHFIYEQLRIGKDAVIRAKDDIIVMGPLGQDSRTMTAYKTEAGVSFATGCFLGTEEEFLDSVHRKYGNDHKLGLEYRAAVELAKVKLIDVKESSE